MEDNTREGRIRSMGKDAVGCVQTVLGKKFLVQFEDGQKIDMSAYSLPYVCEK